MANVIYFKGLNGVRALASLIVVVWHTSQFMHLFGLESPNIHLNGMAGKAVDLFFVLSGFLITFLLMKEKELAGNIDLRKFYLRRIYRIWPIYYLALALSLIFIFCKIQNPPTNLLSSLTLYIFLMANVAYAYNLAISSITPLWSVGVEEQFYLIWPKLLSKSSSYLATFIWIFLGYFILKFLVSIISGTSSNIYSLLLHARINIMCIGAFGAYWVYTKSQILSIILRKEMELLAWSIFIFSCIYQPIHILSFIDSEINSVVYLVLILNVSINDNPVIDLDKKVLNHLGRISYGMYVYHMFAIYLLAYFCMKWNVILPVVVIFGLVVILTIMAAALSYQFIERPILKQKSKFTIIASSNRDPDRS